MVGTIKIPPHIAAQALMRMRPDHRAALADFVNSKQCRDRFAPKTEEEVLRADPVSIGIAIISVFEAVSGIAVGFEAASFVGTAVLASVAIGASLLLSSQPGTGPIDNGTPGFINSAEVRQNHRVSTPNKRIPYGRSLVGGDMYFERALAPYLVHGFIISARQIDAFESVHIGTDVIAFSTTSGDLAVESVLTPQGKFVSGSSGAITNTPDYATNLRVSLKKGTTTQPVDPLLLSLFPSINANFKLLGIATMTFSYKWPGSTYDQRQAMWGDQQAPNPSVLIRGVRVYDPRDLTQSRDVESTWKWSNNAALVQADYLRQPYGGRIDPDDIDYDKVAVAADYDDEVVGTLSGTYIKRHTIDGVVTLNQSPNEVIKGMLTANRGFIVEQAGVFWVSAAAAKTPVLTIHDGLLTGGIDFQGAKPKRDLVNRILSRFISLDRNYQQVDGPPLDRTDLQALDEEILSATVDLPFTADYRTAERLQKAFLETSRLGKTLGISISTVALAYASEDLINEIVTIDSQLFSVVNGNYRVTSVSYSEDYASMILQLTEYDGTIETNWNYTTDEKPFVVANLNV